MLDLSWADFDTIPDSPTRNFRISERQQQILLSFLAFANDRNQWDEMLDTEWDTVDEALSILSDELMGNF